MRQTEFKEYLLKKAAKRLIPLNCLFELTYRCNLKCIHCYIVKKGKRELDKGEIFKILEQLKYAGGLYLTFSGGEILARKDFFAIADYARRLNFALRLFTNGTLITPAIADKIKELYPIAAEISLYGFKDTHEKITKVKGSFDETIKAIKLLRERKVKVYVKAVLMQQNVKEIWELNRFIENNLGAKVRGIGGSLLISPCDDGDRRPLNYRLNDVQLRKYIAEELKTFESLGGKKDKPRRVKDNERLCGAGFVYCGITPYGEVNPCVQIKFKDNCLRDKSLMKIWKEHKEIRSLRDLRMRDKKDCWGCELISYCVTCSGITWLEEGSLLAKLPEACRQARLRKEIYERG